MQLLWLLLHVLMHLLVWCHDSLQHTLENMAEIRSTYKILVRKPQKMSRHKCDYVCWIKGLTCSLAISNEQGAEMFHFCARWEFNDRQLSGFELG